jgi:YVTN family beta-propeller protein
MRHTAPRTYAAALLLALLCTSTANAEPLAYVPIAGSARVQVIDTRNGNTVKMIPVASGPIGVAVDAPRGKVYVAHQGGDRLTVISTVTRAVVGVLPLPTDAWGVIVSADGATAYVALSGLNRIGVVDTATLTLTDTVITGMTPRNLALSPDGTRLYVSNQSSSTLTVIDTTTRTALGEFPLVTAPLGLAIHPNGSTLFAVGFFGDELARYSTAGNGVVGTTATADGPSGVAVNPDASRIYVTATRDDRVTVIDGSTHAVIDSIAVGDSPYGIQVSEDGSRVYVTNLDSDSMSVIDAASNTVIATYPLLDSAFAVGGFLAPGTVPDAPIVGPPGIGDGSLSIAFTPPFDGGHAITGYTATCGATSISATTSPITFSGLTNGTPYTCSVVAHNQIGDSTAATVTATPATLPSAPTLLGAAPGDQQASIAFDAAGSDGGSAITHYTARCHPGDIVADGMPGAIVVAGLGNGIVYRCSVAAVNGIGPGPASAEASVIPGNSGNQADLSISKTNATSFVGGGGRVGYAIDVVNDGPAAVAAARVVDTLEHYFSDAQWTCSGSGGGRCPAGGQGNLDIAVDLPIGAGVHIQLDAALAALPEDPVFNVAAVSVPASIIETDPGDNTASDGPDVRGIFRDGFE